MTADEDLRPAGPVQPEIVIRGRQRAVRDLAQPVGHAVRPVQHGEHAVHAARRARIDAIDPRMGMDRTHEHRMNLASEREVVAEPPASGQQALVLLTKNRPADLVGHLRRVRDV